MLLLAAIAAMSASAQNAPAAPVGASVRAQATIRIITGAFLRLGEGAASGDAPKAQATVVHSDGGVQPARLIEFE
jgi:hypothetical protein